MPKERLHEVSYGSVKIQKLRRIALDANLMSTLGFAEGDVLEIALNTDTREILLRSSSPKINSPKKRG